MSRRQQAGPRDVYSVSRLNREARDLIEGGFPPLWIEAEISNLTRHGSGHWYFSLKDRNAQVRCAMFRGRNRLVGFEPENGQQVLVRARVGLYEARGEFQLIAERMEPAGEGALWQAFEALRKRLEQEGLFAAEHKRPLPALPPSRIGVITSPTGAALRDILITLKRRFPAIPVILYPVPVQGDGAADAIAAMIALADARAETDVLLLARGGGSLEDLWAFNEEAVARAIHACRIPVVTGIGHETDVTIADFAADRRAATPTAGAELLSPDQRAWLEDLSLIGARLYKLVNARLDDARRRLDWLGKRMRHPGRRLQDIAQRFDELSLRMQQACRSRLRQAALRVEGIDGRLRAHDPRRRIQGFRERGAQLDARLRNAMRARLGRQRERLAAIGRALDAVSPLATLGRGYAIVTRSTDGKLVRDAAQLSAGDRIHCRFAEGFAVGTVEETG